MTTHRFFLPRKNFSDDRVDFTADVAHQIRRVLRLRAGDVVVALDGSGDEFVVRLDITNPLSGSIVDRLRNDAEPACELTLYQSLLKGTKFELVLQKGTEIGVSRFVTVWSERAVAGEPGESRHRRYESIVREAAEQSGRGRLPVIAGPISFEAALLEASAAPAVVFWEGEDEVGLSDIDLPAAGPLALFVGPEGGFSEAEVDRAREMGAAVVGLGRRILRAETAAIVAPALVLLGMSRPVRPIDTFLE